MGGPSVDSSANAASSPMGPHDAVNGGPSPEISTCKGALSCSIGSRPESASKGPSQSPLRHYTPAAPAAEPAAAAATTSLSRSPFVEGPPARGPFLSVSLGGPPPNAPRRKGPSPSSNRALGAPSPSAAQAASSDEGPRRRRSSSSDANGSSSNNHNKNNSSSRSSRRRKGDLAAATEGRPWCRYTWTFGQHFKHPQLLQLHEAAFIATKMRWKALKTRTGGPGIRGTTERPKAVEGTLGASGAPSPEATQQRPEGTLGAPLEQQQQQQQPQQQQQQQQKQQEQQQQQETPEGPQDLIRVPLRVTCGTAVYVHPTCTEAPGGPLPQHLHYALDFPGPALGPPTGASNRGGPPEGPSGGPFGGTPKEEKGVLMLQRPLLLCQSEALGIREEDNNPTSEMPPKQIPSGGPLL